MTSTERTQPPVLSGTSAEQKASRLSLTGETATNSSAGQQKPEGGSGVLQIERHRLVYRLALKNGSVDVSDLAQRFDVTTETIRRDLSELQERGLLRRVHGGAVPVEQRDHEPMVDARDMLNAEEKVAIGRLASLEVPQGGTIVIDSGSTGQRLAEALSVEADAHIMTNSLITALTLARRGVKQLSVLGGSVRTNTFAMVDAQTIEAVRAMRVDVLFISCDGLSLNRGLTTPYREEHLVKRAMIESARRVVALVDHSKFGNDQTFCFAGLHEIDVLVTDKRATNDEVEILTEADIEVRRA
jgi:DeoR family transcriptional regulator, fructose operon transcriptional repressor